MILEIDAGNTRIKGRLVEHAQSGSTTAGPAFETTSSPSATEFLASLEEKINLDEISRLRLASVRGEEFDRAFAELMLSRWRIEPEFAEVQTKSNGVTNSYENIHSMGVDRWLAMLAAYDRVKSSCCVLDCGSAITFDWLNNSGMHQGGFIVPGFSLMQDSLARKTKALDVPLEAWSTPVPGTSTDTAISQGLLAMVSGFARHCHEHIGKSGADCHWFLTGGDARLVGTVLNWPHQVEKDLVLDGLALSLP